MAETMKINNKNIEVVRREMPVIQLKFFVDNPRVFSVLRNGGEEEPTQEEIFSALKKMDHVKQLYHDIKRHGELLEAIIVRDEDNQVLEGNSRLAAYKILANEDPIRWGKVKCKILPRSISDSDIYALLGQFHITGKKDWSPYEQAGFLFRRNKHQGIEIEELAEEMGLNSRQVKKLVGTYELMEKYHDKNQSRWSYYEVLFSSSKLKKAVGGDRNKEKTLVKSIKKGEIERAADLRDKVPVMLKNTRIRNTYMSGKIKLGDAVERIERTGSTNNIYKRINDFREWFSDMDTERGILNADQNAKQKINFELKRIEKRLKSLKSRLN